MQNVGLQEQFFAARAAAIELDGREYAFFVQAAVEVDFAVARAFEFFKNHLIHAAACINQRSGDDGE